MNLQELKIKKPPELLAFAEEQGVEGAAMMRRQELMFAILQRVAAADQAIFGVGTIEVAPDGFGYLRSMEANYLPGADDIYVSPTQVRKFGLRTGDTVEGEIRAPKDGERYFAMVQINKINFDDPDALRHRINFDSLTPLYPDEKLKLEMDGGVAVMAPTISEEQSSSRATSSGRVGTRRTGTLTKKAGTTPQQQLDISTRVLDLRRAGQPSRSGRGNGDREVQASGRTQEGRGDPARFDHPTRPRLQHRRTQLRQGADGRCRRQRPAAAQALLRRRPQHRGRRLAHHHRHGADRHRQPHGRGHLRGVQGHR